MICNIGINDMPRGWMYQSELNKKIYFTWKDMITRCYSENFHKKNPTYKDCTVCDKWIKLSGFIDDLPKIDNYELWLNNKKYELDKDIKSNGTNKCYCLENCMFATKSDNVRQGNSTNNYEYMKGDNNLNRKYYSDEHRKKISKALTGIKRDGSKQEKPVVIENIKTKDIIEYKSLTDASEQLNYGIGNLSKICKYNHEVINNLNITINKKTFFKGDKKSTIYYKQDYEKINIHKG